MIRYARILAVLAVLVPHPARAQEPTVQLDTRGVTGSITANGGAVTMSNAGSMASLLIQTTGTFSLTWELQCAADAAGTAFDTDDEIPVTLVSSSPTPADSVATNVAGLYTATIAGCTAVQVIATAYTSGTMGVTLSAVSSGGGSGGGGGSASSVSITQGGNTAQVNASSQLSVTCANCSGSGVSQNEDSAFVDGGATTPAGVTRQDTLASSTSTDGDVTTIKSDSVGRIYVTGTGGTFPTSGLAATDAAVSGNPVYTAGRASAAAPTDVSADGDVVPPWLLRSGAQVIQPTFAGVLGSTGTGASGTGTQRVVTATDSTIGTVTAVTTVSTLTTLSQLGGVALPVEDVAETAAGVGIYAMGVRRDTAASSSGTTGDNSTINLDSIGRLWITAADVEDAAATAGGQLLMVGTVRNDTAASSAGTTGDNANLQTDSTGRLWTNPFPATPAAATYMPMRLTDGSAFLTPAADSTHGSAILSTGPAAMLEATTGLSADTAVSDGQATRGKADTLGRIITTPGCGTNDRVRGYLANTDGASTSVLAAQGAGVIAEIWTILIANSSATDVTVDLRDGTAGSVLTTLMAPATTDTGGGGVYNLNSPLLFTANTAVAADASAAATTLYITVLGCKVK